MGLFTRTSADVASADPTEEQRLHCDLLAARIGDAFDADALEAARQQAADGGA